VGIEFKPKTDTPLFKTYSNSVYLVKMNPVDYLMLAPPIIPMYPRRLDESVYDKDVIDAIINALKRGDEIEPPMFVVDSDSCRVIDHEGRHRAFASYKLGITEIPVALVYYNTSEEKAVDISGMETPPCIVNGKPVLKPQEYKK